MVIYYALHLALLTSCSIADPEILKNFEVKPEGGGMLKFELEKVLAEYKPEEATVVIKVISVDKKYKLPIVIKIELPTKASSGLKFSFLQNEWRANQHLKGKAAVAQSDLPAKNGRAIRGVADVYFFGKMKVFAKDDTEYFVMGMEFQLQDLHTFMFPNGKFVAQQPAVLHSFFLQLLEVLKLLAEYALIHRDIKPRNILVTQDLELLLIDFAFANFDGSEVPTVASGTPEFASLTMHENKNICFGVDANSLVYTYVKIKRGSLPWELFGDNLGAIYGLKINFGAEIMKVYPIGTKFQSIGPCLVRLLSLDTKIAQQAVIKAYDSCIQTVKKLPV